MLNNNREGLEVEQTKEYDKKQDLKPGRAGRQRDGRRGGPRISIWGKQEREVREKEEGGTGTRTRTRTRTSTRTSKRTSIRTRTSTRTGIGT